MFTIGKKETGTTDLSAGLFTLLLVQQVIGWQPGAFCMPYKMVNDAQSKIQRESIMNNDRFISHFFTCKKIFFVNVALPVFIFNHINMCLCAGVTLFYL